jgi:hypothetical protein
MTRLGLNDSWTRGKENSSVRWIAGSYRSIPARDTGRDAAIVSAITMSMHGGTVALKSRLGFRILRATLFIWGDCPRVARAVFPFYCFGGLIHMISYQITDDGMFPRFWCDHCKEPIDDDTAFVFWSASGSIAHVHMGPCSSAMSRLSDRRAWPYSESIVIFLANLLNNTRIPPKKLTEPNLLQDMFGKVASRQKLDRGRR